MRRGTRAHCDLRGRSRRVHPLRPVRRSADLASRSLVVLALVVSACGRPGRLAPASLDPASPEALGAAAADFRAACAPCHGADARGAGPVAVSLKQPPTDLTLLAARQGGTFPFEDTVAVITGARTIDAHGTRAMPVWSIRLGGADAASAVASIAEQRRVDMLARYLATLQRPAPATPGPAAARAPKATAPGRAPTAQKP